MGKDEQKEEREVLDSIFPDEITDVSETDYRVAIQLDVTQDDDDDTPLPTILLRVQYPDDYPDEAPRLDIQNPPNAPKHPYIDVHTDKARLLDALQPTIEESMGMAMVFALVTTLKDSAELLIAERQAAVQAQRDVQAAAAEAEENRKFEGTKVTRHTFLEWSARFKQEMEDERLKRELEKEEELKRKRVKEEKKMTGRELWEKGLAGNVLEDDDDDGVDELEAVQTLKLEA